MCVICLFSLKSSTQLYNHCRIIVEDNSVKCVPLDGFFGIQILPNSIAAGAPTRSQLGELTTLPQTPYSRLAHRASPLFRTFRRPCAAAACGGFTAEHPSGSRYRSNAAARRWAPSSSGASAAEGRSSKCGQCHIDNRRRKLNTD